MESAVQALIILLDYGHPIRKTSESEDLNNNNNSLPSVHPNDVDALGFNVFRKILSSIDKLDQLNFIYKGFVRLLNNVHQAESTYLPYSITRIGYYYYNNIIIIISIIIINDYNNNNNIIITIIYSNI